ncbi:MAG: NADase-type glycan-binding domain-containing protein [Paludibacter sp.]
MKKLICLLLFGVLIKTVVFGNGGPVNYSSVISTGDMRFLNYTDVELLKEDLSFNILGEYCEVIVEYTLQNKSNYSNDTIHYGFPIDFVRDEDTGDFSWNESNVSNLIFQQGNKILKYKQQIDYSIFTDTIKGYDDQPILKRRKWYLTNIIIGKGATETVRVSYHVKSNFIDWATTKSFFVDYGKKYIYWDFTPAQYWGDGIVNEIKINIKVAPKIQRYGDFKVLGLPFQKNDSSYTFSANKFNFDKAKPLYLEYSYEPVQQAKFISDYSIPKAYILSVNASSFKEDYEIQKISDKNYTTAWVPITNKTEWVEFNIKPFGLGAILIVNGYAKSSETYLNNNRIKKIRIDYEAEDYMDKSKTIKESREIDIEDKPFKEISSNNLYSNAFKVDFGEGYLKVRKIKITILDVYKGKKYNDSCISEILLLGYTADNM